MYKYKESDIILFQGDYYTIFDVDDDHETIGIESIVSEDDDRIQFDDVDQHWVSQ